MKMNIYEHFHPDEHTFVDRAWEWVVNAGQYHEVKLTEFLDPRQAFILHTLANRHPDVTIALSGGYAEAERQRALIAPDYHDLSSEELGIQVLSISSGDHKLGTLDHGDYLGAILGLGIKRGKIGDIQVLEDGCHVLVAEEIASFLNINLRQVHRVHVLTDVLDIQQLRTSQSTLEPLDLSVASLRMDGIVSDVYRLSRSKVLVPIKAGRCRLNWKTEEDPSKVLNAGDIVSLQGFGRFKVLEVEGITKKGRYRIKVGKFV